MAPRAKLMTEPVTDPIDVEAKLVTILDYACELLMTRHPRNDVDRALKDVALDLRNLLG